MMVGGEMEIERYKLLIGTVYSVCCVGELEVVTLVDDAGRS